MTTVSQITFLSSKARRGADLERSLGKTRGAHPHQESSGVPAVVARGKQGLEPRSVGLDEESFNLDFVMEEERLTWPPFMRFLNGEDASG
jgi:hypothetical protein